MVDISKMQWKTNLYLTEDMALFSIFVSSYNLICTSNPDWRQRVTVIDIFGRVMSASLIRISTMVRDVGWWDGGGGPLMYVAVCQWAV